MRPAHYEEQWQQLKLQQDPALLDSLARRVASSFIDRYFFSNEYNSHYIKLLCEMATYFDNATLNQISARALFGIVIERLCDDFEELQTETYNRLMSQVTDFLRRLPEGTELDQELQRFNLHTQDDIYNRVESMRLAKDQAVPAEMNLLKVLVLSRVTIGADVAITSIICQRMLEQYPDAEVVVIGNDKLRQIFAEHPRIRVRELTYTRRGGLLERFAAWLELLHAVAQETAALDVDSCLLLDPDSRLTQLGVLPLLAERNYRFFNSRGKQGYPAAASISRLTNLWLDWITGNQLFHYPRVWLQAASLDTAEYMASRCRSGRERHIITLNLGVGGNNRKRVSDVFEAELVLSLLANEDNLVILDMGFGQEELQRSERILAQARSAGIPVASTGFAGIGEFDCNTRLLGVECNVGEIAALIAHSDEFIGYDSACQHIAAALGIKTFTVFAGTNNARFIRRWHACGPNLSEILYVDTISKDQTIDTTELVGRLHDLRLH